MRAYWGCAMLVSDLQRRTGGTSHAQHQVARYTDRQIAQQSYEVKQIIRRRAERVTSLPLAYRVDRRSRPYHAQTGAPLPWWPDQRRTAQDMASWVTKTAGTCL